MYYLGEYYNEFSKKVTKYLWSEPFEDVAACRDLLLRRMEEMKRKETLILSVITKEEEFLGSVEVRGLGEYCPEVSVWIKESEWGNGYAYNALYEALKNVHFQYDKSEFYYEADIRNTGAMKLLRKFEKDYEIMEQDLEKVTTDSGKKLEMRGYILKYKR